MRDVIIEGSKPGCFKNTLIQVGMEKGSAVGTAGMKIEVASGENDEYCTLFASPRRPDILYTLKELGRASRRVIRAQADSDWAGYHDTRKSTSCGMIWWGGVLITSYARTQSTIATRSAESEYYGACACASEAAYVKELLSFIGEETHIHLELDASSATSMGSRIGLGKARHVAIRYLIIWLLQLVADKTIRLVTVKGTQHPPDVGTKYLSKQGMLHAKSMLGLMEPEPLTPFGYK
eukprot:5716097-Amphidinium_carterae.1